MKKILCYYNCSEKDEFVVNNLNNFCKNKINCEKCNNFYKHIFNSEDGLYECPYNFNCIKKNNKIYNCLLIKGKYNFSKVKMKKDNKQEIFDENKIYNLIEIEQDNERNLLDNNNISDNISDFLHDITKVNKLIERYSKNISTDSLNKKDKAKRESIIHLSDFIMKRIDLYRYVSNPEIIKIGRKRERDAYKLWDIYRYIFNEIGYESNIKINMKICNINGVEEQNNGTKFKANDSITALPFLLIDNAIKYSTEGSDVNIIFYQTNEYLKKIEICSYPSYVINEKTTNFFERGYRALNNTSKSSGSGLGLSIVKQICDFNDIDISIDVDCDEFGKQIFIVKMVFQDA